MGPYARVTHVLGYFAHNKLRFLGAPTVGLCLGPYGGPREGGLFLMSEVPLYRPDCAVSCLCPHAPHLVFPECEDRVLDGPASEEKGSKGRN